MSLSRRPLTSSDADAELFVDREEEIRRIERSVELRANVLVVGPPGSGKTSLLRRLQGRSRDAGDEWVYVDCSPWKELEHALAAIGAALGRETRNRPRVLDPEEAMMRADLFAMETPRIVTEADVHRVLDGEARVIAVDGLDPEIAFDLFGRFRDTLWEHEHRWVVTADEVYRGEFLRPPADVFFESVVDLAELDGQAVAEMLLARARRVSGQDATRLAEIAGKLEAMESAAYPARVITIALELLSMNREFEEFVRERRDAEERADELGPAAADVFRALRELGSAHAGDERLLHRVNLSRSRVVQLLKDLEDAGLVSSRRQGRRVMYEVVPEVA